MIRVADFYEYFAGLLRGYCLEKIVCLIPDISIKTTKGTYSSLV